MRRYTTALETFYIDMNTYPPYTTSTSELAGFPGARYGTPSFKNFPVEEILPPLIRQMDHVNGKDLVNGLTTPVAYLNILSPDPFSSSPTSPFAYLGDKDGYLLWSPGPDGKFDIDWESYDTKVGPLRSFR